MSARAKYVALKAEHAAAEARVVDLQRHLREANKRESDLRDLKKVAEAEAWDAFIAGES